MYCYNLRPMRPTPLGRYQELGYKKGDLPKSELASQQVLSLPVFPELTEEEQDYVVQAIKAFFQNGGAA